MKLGSFFVLMCLLWCDEQGLIYAETKLWCLQSEVKVSIVPQISH